MGSDRQIQTYTGRTPAIWEDHAVVYGEIMEVVSEEKEIGVADITLSVETTLTGSFDAAKNGTIIAPVQFALIDHTIHEAPRAKTKVVAFLRKREDGHYVVETNYATFMPEACPLVVVENFEDAKLKEIISRLRETWKYARDTKDKKKEWWEE